MLFSEIIQFYVFFFVSFAFAKLVGRVLIFFSSLVRRSIFFSFHVLERWGFFFLWKQFHFQRVFYVFSRYGLICSFFVYYDKFFFS